MKKSIVELIDKIAVLPKDWHGAGSVNLDVLRAIASHAENLGDLLVTAETGSGKTTLLFSHMAKDHMVFALDKGKSITNVKQSPLLNTSCVTFVEGPTQITLPSHTFHAELDIALIDGPHGYPFPDMEYYYFYPVIKTGGLLLVDDIQIPTIRRMYEIIKAGDMFKPVDEVGYMAFFQRTDEPMINPLSDSWWLQGYNREHYEEITRPKEVPRRKLLNRLLRR